MSNRVTIVDYGLGNLLSVERAFRKCDAEVAMASTAEEILAAERLVLPGVGAFGDGMRGLRERGLIEPIKAYARNGRPLLGICLGMQMLFDMSEEFGNHEGLGLIPGRVTAIPGTTTAGLPHKIPHISWNSLKATTSSWEDTIFQDLPAESSMYFVHSFTAAPAQAEHRLADCDYNGRLISAAVRAGKVYGCQFHPEKSGEKGLRIIRAFTHLA